MAKKSSGGFNAPLQPSEELAEVVGSKPLSRGQVMKSVWRYIKKHNLQNPKNKREIIADEALKPIFKAKKVNMFEMTKLLGKHLS
jgi:upstream activation factor subunit UAF30